MNADLTWMDRIGRVRKFRIQSPKVREDLDKLKPKISHRSNRKTGVSDGDWLSVTDCSEEGLIFCELVGDDGKRNELTRKQNLIKGVCARQITLDLEAQDEEEE